MTTPSPIKTHVVDRLEVRVYRTRGEMGAAAGADVIASMKDLLAGQDRIRMVFASAASQRELLKALRGASNLDWPRVTAFHMDEYLGLRADAPQQFSVFLQEHLFRHVRPGEVHLINSSNDVEAECARYGNLIRAFLYRRLSPLWTPLCGCR